MKKKILVVGAGAAGIGMGIVLKKMGLDFVILEKDQVGKSFLTWPPGTRFISPSFTGNFFGVPDLNSLSPETSPAFTLETEHPTGKQYAKYLNGLAYVYELPVLENVLVQEIQKNDDGFEITTDRGNFETQFVIWAGGEYQFPKTSVCEGSEHAIHNTKIKDWDVLEGNIFPIIGGYESGFDTAIQLAKIGKKSVIFDSKDCLGIQKSDASFSLSPVTKDRYRQYQEFITVKPNTRIQKIEENQGHYFLTSEENKAFGFETQPILATGFETSLTQVKDFFVWKDGSPQLTENDESTKVEGFFLVGPQVKHQNVIFCFIYKFRQRFAIVAETIAQYLGLESNDLVQQTIDEYQDGHFYLKDLSCCENECTC